MFQRIDRRVAGMLAAFARGARMAVGVPDYAAYVAHVRRAHPDAVPMTEAEFVRERLQARYARGRSRCC